MMNITKENKKIILANNLQYLMTINNLTRKDVCKALGLPKETLRSWLSGIDYPPVERIAMLANFFHVDIAVLIKENHMFDGLDDQDITLIYSLQQEMFQQGMPPMHVQLFSANCIFIIKYLKERNLYGGAANE